MPKKSTRRTRKSTPNRAARKSTSRNGGSASKAAPTAQMRLRTVTGQLVVQPASKAIDWYAHVFGAKEIGQRQVLPDGRVMHATIQIGDSKVMISDPFGPAPTELNGAYLHIEDKGIQAMWDHAIEEGATEVLPLANQFWGQKYGQLRDPFGQLWSFGWPVKMSEAEKKRLEVEARAMMAAPMA